MKKALYGRRGRGELLAASAVGLLIAGTLAAGGTAAEAATRPAPGGSGACTSQIRTAAHVGHIGGIVRAVQARSGCVHNTGDPASGGTPPLLYHGGPVMSTKSTGALKVTPIFWNPTGHPMDSNYKGIIGQYLKDVGAASGQHTNVYSTATQYYGSNGTIRYNIRVHKAINDTHALPADACTVEATDTANIYADNSGYDACLDDSQIIAETDRVVTAKHLRRDYAHIYVLFLPKHVESCFYAGTTATSANFCTINHQPSAAYCAYHSQAPAPTGTVYANMPFPVYTSPVGYTCGSDAAFPAIETPNGNADADTEISPTSHEIMEAITDPDVSTGWYDSSGYENGDECAYVYGTSQGTAGSLYNQVINNHQYLTQEEFSNIDFAATGGGCLQGE